MAILKSSKAGTSFDTETGIRTNLDGTTTQIQDTVNPETGTISSNDTPIVTPTELKVGTSFVTKETTPTSTVSSPTLTPLQTAEQDIQNKTSSSQSEYEKLLADVGLIKGKEGGYQEELGATQAKEAYTNYVNQLEQEKRALELRKRDLFSQGLTKTQAQNFYDAEERQSLQKQADIAILGNAAMGKYNFALDEAKRKVDLELKPLEDELALKKQQYEDNKDMLSVAEKAKLTALYAQEAADLDVTRKDKITANTMYVNALQSKAPQSLVNEAKAIIDRGGSSAEVANILGKYSMSESDRLDINLKQAQISKIYDDMSKLSAEEQKVAKEKQDQLVKNEAIKREALKKIELISDIKNNPAISTSVGTSRTTRKGYFVGIPFIGGVGSAPDAILNTLSGKKQSLIGAVNQLTNKEFLDAVIGLKSQGGTLGQLTEREGAKLQGAATKIASWEIKDKQGNVTGYNIDEKNFLKEIQILEDSTNAIYKAAGGILPNSPESIQAADDYTNNIVDGALQVSPYTQAGYNL